MPPLARWWFEGRCAGLAVSLQRLILRHIILPCQPLPSLCWSRPSATPSVTTVPAVAADLSASFVVASFLHCEAGSYRSGGVWLGRPIVRFAFLLEEVASFRLRFSIF